MSERLKRILSWTLTAVTLAWVVRFLLDHSHELRMLHHLDYPILAAIVGLQLLALGLNARRYQLVLRQLSGQPLRFLQWAKYFVTGQLFNVAGPTLGTIYRGVLLKSEHQLAYTDYVGGLLLVAWLDTVSSTLVMTMVVFLWDRHHEIAGWDLAWVLLAVSIAALLTPFVSSAIVGRLGPLPPGLGWIRQRAGKILEALQLCRDTRWFARILALTVALTIPGVGAVYASSLAMGQALPIGAVVVYFLALKITFMVNLTPGNLGVREIVFGLLSEAMGAGVTSGILIALLLRISGLLSLGLAGLGLLAVSARDTAIRN